MKVTVDFDLCESNALCEALAPDVFAIDDDDYLQVLKERPDEADLDGFNLASAVTPGTMADVVTHVVPELRRRGRMPAAADAGGPTLRERYGTGDGARLAKDHPGSAHRTL